MTSRNALSPLHGKLSCLLLEDGLCADVDESLVIAELILDVEQNTDNGGTTTDETSSCLTVKTWTDHEIQILANIVEYVAIEKKHAKELYAKLFVSFLPNINAYEENHDDDSEEAQDQDWRNGDNAFDNDRADYLQDGECELCDRYIKLTKHHLIPKETWPRIQTKLLHAAEEKAKGEVDKALSVLGPGLTGVIDRLSTERSTIRDILHETCDICRQCHSAVHRVLGNMDLALHYNTVDKLLENDDIRKFCRWASKQPPRKYARR
jgi:hypothetical protein